MVIRNLEIKMPGDPHFNRIDTLEIKVQIGKKLGNQRAHKYFAILNQFLGSKLGKAEFDKLCVATIGRENIKLHNHLLKAILNNACLAKVPPPKGNKVGELGIDKVANGYQRSCLQLLRKDVFPQSPRKGRTPGNRKIKDRPSPLGPHGKPNAVAAAAAAKDLGHKTMEQQSATELLSLGSRPVEVTSVEDGEEVDQAAISPGIHSRSPVMPPLGVSWNGKGNRKVFSSLSSSAAHAETCNVKGELPDTNSLKKRLEQKLEKEGLTVSLDCVNLLNNGLDTYIKGLIKPSLELATSRLGNIGHNHISYQAISGMNGLRPARFFQSPAMSPSVSMLDFRTAMELNPQVLGEDWPMQLEKVCLRESGSGD